MTTKSKETSLIAEQAHYIFQYAGVSAFTQLIVVGLIYLQLKVIDHDLLLLWGLLISIPIAIKLLLVWLYRKDRFNDIKFWLKVFTYTSLMVGIGWAFFMLFHLTAAPAELKYIFIVIVCALLAGTAPILAAWPPAYYALTLPQFITIPAVLFYLDSAHHYFVMTSFIIFCLMLLTLQRIMHRNIKQNANVKTNNARLLNDLHAEIELRERIIAERTEALHQSLSEQQAIVNNKMIGIAIVQQRKILWVNSTFEQMFGYDAGETIGLETRVFYANDADFQMIGRAYAQLRDGVVQNELEFKRKNGDSIWINLRGTVLNRVKDESLWMFVDVTERKLADKRLRFLAHYDALTELPNRALFTDHFQQAVAHSDRKHSLLAVCFVDLDNFKAINDVHGHDVGDKLLIKVAQRFKNIIRQEDTVARFGGDEFILLLNDLDDLTQCIETIQRVHETLAEPYIVDREFHQLSASTGITLYPSDQGDADTLIRHADQAMYIAKQGGRNRYHFFDIEQEKQVIDRNVRLADIKRAMDNEEFQLYYQPKVDMLTGDVFGVEGLLRRHDPINGVIPPLEFLPLIEGTRFELDLGERVIRQALRQLDRWQKKGLNIELSINVSAQQLASPTFVETLRNSLAEYPEVDSKKLQLEVLESSVLSDVDTVTQVLKNCQNNLGVSFALDDFGTGYSSLTHLRNLPAEMIKIDQTFVKGMLADTSDYAIVESVIGLADSFNRFVIAEGVETQKNGLMLLFMGCNLAQGYTIARPMPPDTFLNWLEDYKPYQHWLDFAQLSLTDKDRHLALFYLTSQHWKNHLVANIFSLPQEIEQWPVMNRKLCHCGYWFKRMRQRELFDDGWLKKLNKAHNKFYTIAHRLFVLHHAGDVEQAQQGIDKLEQAYEEMHQFIQCDVVRYLDAD